MWREKDGRHYDREDKKEHVEEARGDGALRLRAQAATQPTGAWPETAAEKAEAHHASDVTAERKMGDRTSRPTRRKWRLFTESHD